MKRWYLVAFALLVFSCKKPSPTPAPVGESCTLSDDGGTLDASRKTDGVYGVTNGQIEPTPFATVEVITKTGEGVDPASGKRWIGLRLEGEQARALRDYTSFPTGKRIAVVAHGEVASLHKVREPIMSTDFQISCCNPKACDRWLELLAHKK